MQIVVNEWILDFLISGSNVRQIPDDLITLSEDIISKTPEDDLYLVELAFSTDDKTIITTDTRLKSALRDVQELSVILLDDYLDDYIEENNINC